MPWDFVDLEVVVAVALSISVVTDMPRQLYDKI